MRTIVSITACLATGVAIGLAFGVVEKRHAPPPVAALAQAIQEADADAQQQPDMHRLCGRMQELRDRHLSDYGLDAEYDRYCRATPQYVNLADLARVNVCTDQLALASKGDKMAADLYADMVTKGHCQ